MCRLKVSNLYEIVIDFSLPNTGSISANSSFQSISFTGNENDWENFILGTVYKKSDQIPDTGTNIECKPVKERLQKSKKQWLTLDEK